MKPSLPQHNDDASEGSSAEKARAALIARLEQLHQKPGGVRPPQSLQPTPEAGKSRVTRLRRKQRLLTQRSKRDTTERPAIPRTTDPLGP
jgi:hypothetical protein